MKAKIKNLVRGAIILIVIVLVFNICTSLLENKSARSRYKDFFEHEVNYDVVLLGSSHMLNSALPLEMWKEAGISSYNWGYSNCTPAVEYYLLKEIVKYTDPKVVVIDLYGLVEYQSYGNGKYRTDRLGQQRVQFDMLPMSVGKIKAVKDIFDDYSGNLDFILKLSTYHNRWKELSAGDFDIQYSVQKGGDALFGLGTGKGMTPIGEDQVTELDSVCYDYFLQILEFCQSEGIAVLCTHLPYPASEEGQRVANSIKDVIQDYDNVEYVNLLNSGIVDYSVDLYLDNSHLNTNGAIKVSRWLANYLSENYQLDDYSGSEYWAEGYEEFRQLNDARIIQTDSLQDKLSAVYGGNYTVELTLRSDCKLLEKDTRISKIIEGMGTCGAITVNDEITYCTIPCDVKIDIFDSITGELIDTKGYTYAESALSIIVIEQN